MSQSNYQIRRISALDGPTLRTLRLAALTSGVALAGVTLSETIAQTPGTFAQMAQTQSTAGDTTTFFLDVQGTSVGTISAWHTVPASPRAWLLDLWVPPSHQNGAPALVHAAGRWLFKIPLVQHVSVWIASNDYLAIALYQRAGFWPDSVMQAPSEPGDVERQRFSVTPQSLRKYFR